MRAYGITDKLIGLVKALYDGFTCAVRNNGEIPGRHRREARMLHVGIPVSKGHRLDDEEGGWTDRGQASDGTLQDYWRTVTTQTTCFY